MEPSEKLWPTMNAVNVTNSPLIIVTIKIMQTNDNSGLQTRQSTSISHLMCRTGTILLTLAKESAVDCH